MWRLWEGHDRLLHEALKGSLVVVKAKDVDNVRAMRHLPSRAEHKGRVSSEKRRTLRPAKLEGVDIYAISV